MSAMAPISAMVLHRTIRRNVPFSTVKRDGVAGVGRVAQDSRVRGGMATNFATSRAHWMNFERMDDLSAGNDLNI
jgi:hypothetical protein